jgi:hypothetical protein
MKHFYLLLILAVILFSCEREMGFEGPSLIDQFGTFNVIEKLTISNKNIDFAEGETSFFNAEFSKAVNWEIIITGLNSGAIKSIYGNSRILNQENALWDGSTSSLPMFKIENCSIDLKVSYNVNSADTLISVEDSIISVENLTIVSNKNNSGLLIADFETGLNPNWDPFVQSGGNMSFNISSNQAPQGNFYYDMGGNVDWDWLIGMVDIPANGYGAPTFDLNENGDKVYFNVMLYLPENLPNPPIVLFQFREDDNGNGVFETGLEDMYSIEIKDLEFGWQLISIKYTDLPCLSNGTPIDPDGNGIHNPDMLNMISVLMLAQQGNGFSQTYMDYMIFTENEPLNP